MRLSRLSPYREKLNFCDNRNNREAIIATLRPIYGSEEHPGAIEAHTEAVEAHHGAKDAHL